MRRRLGFVVLAAAALSPAAANAQPTADTTRADALFNAAKQLRDGGQLAEACPMFAQSQQLAPAVGVTLYLADCYERMGKTSSAWQQFRAAEKMAHEHGDEKRATTARTRAEALEPKLPQLTVAAGAGSHEGWEVLVDGARLPPENLNHALAVDPGDHLVTVNAPGQAPRTLKAHLDAANRQASVSIDPPAAAGAGAVPVVAGAGGLAAAAEATAPTPTEPVAATAAGSSTRFWAGMALVGGGVVGLGLGTAYLVKRNQSMTNGTLCDPPYEDKADRTAAIVAYSLGGAALATALVLYLTAPSPKEKGMGLLVAPTLIPGGGGATFHATF